MRRAEASVARVDECEQVRAFSSAQEHQRGVLKLTLIIVTFITSPSPSLERRGINYKIVKLKIFISGYTVGRFAGGVGGFRGGASGSKIPCFSSVGKARGDGAVGICGLTPAYAGPATGHS